MAEYCDFLQGVCILQNALAIHLSTESFYNPELIELTKSTGGVKFIPYDAQADETATTLVTMRRSNIVLGAKGNLTGSIRENTFMPAITIMIHISAQSYYLAEKLGQEILQYIASIQSGLRSFNLNIGSITLTPTENNKERSPNYFTNNIAISGSIPITMWKTQSSDDILSSIKTNITFNGQKILS